jgi:capsular polysaccharide biosynthesis protein
LLLPATLRRFGDAPAKVCDHHDIMRAFGYAGLPAIEIDAPYCFVEQVYWLENGWIQNMPAAHVQALRAHVASLRPPPGRHNLRLYIARRQTRRVANQAELEAFLRARGFDTHNLENLSVDQQIDLFAQAEWVVAPHGAELGNLLFCRPGTKVLELAPDSGFKPYYSYICNKLGLSHGILPCPTHDGGFFGDMTVDLEKFVALFRMLKQRM